VVQKNDIYFNLSPGVVRAEQAYSAKQEVKNEGLRTHSVATATVPVHLLHKKVDIIV